VVIESIKPYYTRGCILIISNPVDIITQKVSEWLDIPNGMVFGSGCLLDTSRFVRTVADYLNLSTGVVNGYLVGEHGDGQVPIWSRVSVGGIPIETYCQNLEIEWNDDIRNKIETTTRNMGSEIINAKGKTHYGIATAVCYIADAVINQRPMIVSVTSPLMGEQGVRGVSMSVPSVVGPTGVQQRIREKWDPDEYRRFFDSVEKVRGILNQLES
jgi:L-lactate dehydrogenase